MTDIIEKYRRLVDLLIERTIENKLEWRWDKSRRSSTAWLGGTALIISEDQNQNHDDLYTVSILNTNGEILETFTDETISVPYEQMTDESNYFKKLQTCYTLIHKRATGADVALDNILKDLESGNDLKDAPF